MGVSNALLSVAPIALSSVNKHCSAHQGKRHHNSPSLHWMNLIQIHEFFHYTIPVLLFLNACDRRWLHYKARKTISSVISLTCSFAAVSRANGPPDVCLDPPSSSPACLSLRLWASPTPPIKDVLIKHHRRLPNFSMNELQFSEKHQVLYVYMNCVEFLVRNNLKNRLSVSLSQWNWLQND